MTQVKARIDELTADAAVRAGVSRESILRELKALAFANSAHYQDLVMSEDDTRHASRRARRAIGR